MSTLNKLPQVKPDSVRTDEGWEDWRMEKIIESIQRWLNCNKANDNLRAQGVEKKRKRHWFSQKGVDPSNSREQRYLYCEQKHWGESCPTYDTVAKRRKFFAKKRLCFNCARTGHREVKCRGKGCYKCKNRHHTSLCDRNTGGETETAQGSNSVFNGYTPSLEDKSLPAIVPLRLKVFKFWAYLDKRSRRNYISKRSH